MRKALPWLVASLPGLVLAAWALFGYVPTARDGPSYFLPLRLRTAQVLTGQRSPWLLVESGCGEPFYANPQSALLYPPAWGVLLLPPERALGVEVGLHLAWLGLGVLGLCRALGGEGVKAVAAAWGVQLSGPLLSAAGMLNNLETAAWLPWMWWASLAGRWRRLALALAAGFLAAEPSLALVGAAVAFWLAPGRRALLASLGGMGLAAVQLVPMALWIAGGDRGPAKPLEVVSAGGVALVELPALLVAGWPAPAVEVKFLPNITLPAWCLLALGGLGKKQAAHRRLALASLACLFLAVLPTLPWGDALWAGLSLGLVRLPGRFLVPGAVALAALAGALPWPRRVWWWGAATGVAVAGLLFSSAPWLALAQAAFAAAAPWLPAAAVAGAAALAVHTVPELALARWAPAPPACGAAQAGQRVFTLPVDGRQLHWALEHSPQGPLDLAWGYSALLGGRQVVRSHAPLRNRHLIQHLTEADKGPGSGWWVASLGASRLLALRPVPGYPVLCQERGVWVHANPQAFPLWGLAAHLPAPEETPSWIGAVRLVQQGLHAWVFQLAVPQPAVFLWLFAPDPGWKFLLDGDPVAPVSGVGILQGIPVPPGEHRLEVRYRPPGLVVGLVASLVALAGVTWRRCW